MSYLLEALQKSQKDRDQQLPNLQTPAIQIEVPDEAPRSPWLYIALAALLINTILIAYLLLKPSNETPTVAAALPATSVSLAASAASTTVHESVTPNVLAANQTAISTATPLTARERIAVQQIDEPPLAEHTPVSAASTSQTANDRNDSASASHITPTANNELSSVPDVYELTEELRAQIPALEMNSHIYSPTQSDSFVMINNTSLTPGAALTDELRLLAVTPDGAILQFRDTKFLLPAMKSFKP